MGGSANYLCIKCDGGGKMLVCSDSSCPIVVHEKCMGCRPYFDREGNFYCPYCLCRQTTAESCKAIELVLLKKRALSAFLNKEMVNSEKLLPQPSHVSKFNHIDDNPNASVAGQQTVSDMIVADGCESSDRQEPIRKVRIVEVSDRMDAEHDVDGQPLHDRDVEDPQKDGQPNEIPERERKMTGNCKQISVQNDQRNEGCQENGQPKKIPGGERKIKRKFQLRLAQNEQVTGQQLYKDAEEGCLIEISEREKVIRRKFKQRTDENEPEVDDQQPDKDVEDRLGEILESRENLKKKSMEVQAERKENEADGGGESDTISTEREPIIMNNETQDEPSNPYPKKRSSLSANTSRKVSGLTETSPPEKCQLAGEHSKGRNYAFWNGKRKKVRWSEEEEEMLKEGVHKFSITANKNIPWRKILDFGRHVFDGTRTPADLKDKWRTLWANKV
ncbi:unnamed protein product [Cuscuta europaea]|uniref:Myb-like domain-containing protein n=1 Tax=Cuscuta europaea TaxID=41803 RepID=A0A9P0ZD09_CUSEU|nr:unnamed protein product [Cuscuta europaea]